MLPSTVEHFRPISGSGTPENLVVWIASDFYHAPANDLFLSEPPLIQGIIWGSSYPVVPSATIETSPVSIFESLLQRLGRLRDGWAGTGSIAPSATVLADLSSLATALQGVRSEPSAEVDIDGTISLIWDREDGSFSMTVTGNGRVVGTLSPYTPAYAPWSFDVTDERAVSEKLEEFELSRFISADAVQ
jgi:hypothetical protein